MRVDEFAKMRMFEQTHWWFLGRRFLLRSLLGSFRHSNALILDAGCGTGLAASELRHLGTVVGLDMCPEAFRVGEWDKLGLQCLASVVDVPFSESSFDLIAALDVIEHLEDEMPSLREFYRVCKPGGTVLITVPAHKWLWSPHDQALGHYRRYRRHELGRKLRKAGFDVRKLTYAVSIPFPMAVVFRLLRRLTSRGEGGSDLAPVARPLNAFLTAVMRSEAFLVRHITFPFGLSVVAMAVKPDIES